MQTTLSKPKLAKIEGTDEFSGHLSYFTVDYDYTKGPENLSDKRVGIIGTGATAVQAIPS